MEILFSSSYCIGTAFITGVVIWATIYVRRIVSNNGKKLPATPNTLPKTVNRKPGTWSPIDYKMPVVPPYPDWSVYTTKPLPYRPFKYGPKYPITMGLRRMPWDDWIELDNQFTYFHAEKSRRIAELGGRIAQTAPEGLNGAYELLEELSEYLPQRYPDLFIKTIAGLDNVITGERINIRERPLKEDPMQVAARLVQDDLVIVTERADGQYYLAGGAVAMPGLWCLEERLGMPLSQIHIDLGKVPGFKEKLERGVMNLFRRIEPHSPVQRNTWYIIGNDAINADGFSLGAGEKNMPVQNFTFKTERQTVRRYGCSRQIITISNRIQRRLPRSGAVAFLFRTYTVRIDDIVKEPYVPGRLASAIRSWDDETARYKGRHTFDEVLLKYLDEKHQEQIANGLDLTKEDEVRAFPY